MEELTIRPATRDDAAALLPLARAFVTSFPLDEAAFRRSFVRLLDDEQACLFAADAGPVVGYLLGFVHDTFFANGPVGWVEELMVQEAWRRRRVGERLMRAFERWAEARGCRMVALATRRAATFYQALGYDESATYFRRLLP